MFYKVKKDWVFVTSYIKSIRSYISTNELSHFKVGLPPSKEISFYLLNESPLKMIKNAFYIILKALFALKIFKYLSEHFSHVEEMA